MDNLSIAGLFFLSLGSGHKSNNEIDGFHLSFCYHHTAGAKPRWRRGVDRKRFDHLSSWRTMGYIKLFLFLWSVRD